MKRITIATVFMITIIGLAACGDSIVGPDTLPGGFVEVDERIEASSPDVAERGGAHTGPRRFRSRDIAQAKHRKARMGRNPRTGATIQILPATSDD